MIRLHLLNEFLSLEILPSAGGKIASLFDKSNGQEWLWANPWLPLRNPLFSESYVGALDFGGLDEIFPSVDPCRIPTPDGEALVPDHGDLVQLPWRVVSSGAEHVEMEVEGRSLPFLFRRRLVLEGRRIQFHYSVENRAAFAFPWLWCAHPLVPLDADLSLEAEADFQVLYASGAAAGLQGRRVSWNELPPRAERWAAKLFSEKGSVSQVRIRRGNGASLGLSWKPSEIPYLGLWVNNGGWSGCGSEPYFNLGIEPATLPIDNLTAAENPPVLQPGETRRWSLEVNLNPQQP
jgi:galactose mutarotase-like enzyme